MPSPEFNSGDEQVVLSQDQYLKIHEDIAREIAKELAKTVLADLQLVWEDIKHQYQEHNNLLSRQGDVLQQLTSHCSADGTPGFACFDNTYDDAGVTMTCAVCQPWRISPAQPMNPMRDDIRISQVPVVPPLRGMPHAKPLALAAMPKEATLHSEESTYQPQPAARSLFALKKTSELDRMVATELTWENDKVSFPSRAPADVVGPLVSEPRRQEIAPAPETTEADAWDPPQGSTDKLMEDNDCPEEEADEASQRQRESPSEVKFARLGRNSPLSDAMFPDGVYTAPEHQGRRRNAERQTIKKMARYDKFFGELGIDKDNLDEPEYSVEIFYRSTGTAQAIARSDWFGNVTLIVIGLNALYIGVDADNNNAETLAQADIGFQVCENAFCLFFTFEWVVRFLSFEFKLDGLKDAWFKFDGLLLVMMIVETWMMSLFFSGQANPGIPTGLLKMLRLLRLFRMARLMRAFPELVAMIKGVRQASRAVGSALMLLALLVYVFAIVMFTFLKDSQNQEVHDRFARLGTVMWTLLLDGTFMDNIGYVVRPLLAIDGYGSVTVFMFFVLGSALTVMNMLIGVLCEVVSAVAAAEKEDGQIRMVKDRLLGMLRELDEDESGLISREEIQKVLCHHDAMEVLKSLNVDAHTFISQLEMYYEHGEDLSIHAIMDLILMLRSERSPTIRDILHIQSFARWQINNDFQKVTESLDDVKKSEEVIQKAMRISVRMSEDE